MLLLISISKVELIGIRFLPQLTALHIAHFGINGFLGCSECSHSRTNEAVSPLFERKKDFECHFTLIKAWDQVWPFSINICLFLFNQFNEILMKYWFLPIYLLHSLQVQRTWPCFFHLESFSYNSPFVSRPFSDRLKRTLSNFAANEIRYYGDFTQARVYFTHTRLALLITETALRYEPRSSSSSVLDFVPRHDIRLAELFLSFLHFQINTETLVATMGHPHTHTEDTSV